MFPSSYILKVWRNYNTSQKQVMNNLLEISSNDLKDVADLLVRTRDQGRRVYLAGNGGSASTVSHFAADLENLGFDTKCLVDNPARITALINDVGWGDIYTEQMNHFKKGDVLILASVHGAVGADRAGPWSRNLYAAAMLAIDKGGVVLSFVGNDGGALKEISLFCLSISSADPYIVEGIHSVLTHLICAKIEELIT